ncbi:Ergot alkaloid biosynthesis protein [Penicillium expansum]|uniref:Ergot alkaloid biosynthesis protein n=1 Tax=Penicillium expansum TaxID=27334 RepID=A0A0A2J928_PENEN|nr:Ergot alkaloid biosynthesis protein [Penicillium expansum]KGO43771.1 Ergot alkaloid biosynthesis protein [Penicillium expansum]KGO51937.1 Ergot alkaloid biosynthesis protein [Penicillium expansum]
MTTLLLGGRGKTSRRIASLLHAANAPFLVASRSVDLNYPHKQVHFDWLDEKSYETPFSHVAADGMQPISTVYLVPPPVFDLAPPMLRFIDFARPRGVRRFVLLSASTIDLGGPAMGQMHEYLAKLLDIEYAVLRPTWFMENFSAPQEYQYLAIKNDNKLYSATGNGKIPFVSANDIARVAFKALTDRIPHNTDHIILGSKVLTYDQVAMILSSHLGREISHTDLSEAELAKRLESTGMPPEDAMMLAGMDTMIKGGAEDRLNDVVREVTGVGPRTFENFVAKNKECWL